ncbi:Lrp/AsnC family transcriptional regulator [Paraflavitalea pollutisoli]|uniref:Lrp/AsnC family transcriptional regulator n=1 Tax=Paraflavitalea pollutisoli TaxID=3034143 RepID=UPI0023EBEC3B|nr:Lrp/AsnC family transcriptional regulator [Paraflavitalea sp. H1-2-19X]
MHELDEQDKQLLRLLQQNNRLTTDQLAKKVNLSQSAVQRRLTRLREKKIIEADVSIIAPAAASVGITCVVDVILHEGGSKAVDQFKAAMQKSVEVAQCYYVTGTYDFVLIVNMRDMQHFEQFSKKLLMDNPNVKHFYTHVVMDRVKSSYALPL